MACTCLASPLSPIPLPPAHCRQAALAKTLPSPSPPAPRSSSSGLKTGFIHETTSQQKPGPSAGEGEEMGVLGWGGHALLLHSWWCRVSRLSAPGTPIFFLPFPRTIPASCLWSIPAPSPAASQPSVPARACSFPCSLSRHPMPTHFCSRALPCLLGHLLCAGAS